MTFQPVPVSIVRRARYEVRDLLSGYPRLYLSLARWRHGTGGGAEAVGDRTEMMIEGYPRSGNTFAVAAFRLAQQRPVIVAHHLHSPAQVLEAVRRRIPALVLLREPEDAVLSTALWHPGFDVRAALRHYVRFHSRIRPARDGFVVGTFDAVRTDFGTVIRSINTRFGTAFAEFEHTPQNEARCFALIELDNSRHLQEGHYGRGQTLEAVVARPSVIREEMKERLRATFRSTELADLKTRALRCYEDLVSAEP